MISIDLGGGTLPVGLQEAKGWMRVERDDEDDLIATLIASAVGEAEAETGIALARRGFRLVIDKKPSCGVVKPAKRPIVSIDALRAYDGEGAEQLFDVASNARVSPGGEAVMVADAVWAAACNGVEIDVTLGLASEAIPAAIKRAILMIVATSYEVRSALGREVEGAVANEAALTLLRAHRRIGI